MDERRTRKDIERRAAGLDLVVRTWAPGDGRTRYRFFVKRTHGNPDYFEGSGVATALGVKDADTWLDGYMVGYREGRESAGKFAHYSEAVEA